MSQKDDYRGFVPWQLKPLVRWRRLAYFWEGRDLFCGRGFQGLNLLIEVVFQLCCHIAIELQYKKEQESSEFISLQIGSMPGRPQSRFDAVSIDKWNPS